MNRSYSNPEPHPKISVTRPNRELAILLTQDLAAAKSEMTTIHQYVYQSWMIQEKYPEISEGLSKIAAVEMHHFDILGKLIQMLGGNPKCQSINRGRFTVWNGNMINYHTGIRQILLNDISSEQFAYKAYTLQSASVPDPKVSAILARLSLDEKLHAEILHDYLLQATSAEADA